MSEWQRYRLAEVADLYDGPHATPKKVESGPWFLSIASLQNGRFDLDQSAHISDENFVRWTRRVEPGPGDVLFSYETKIGAAALMPEGIRGALGRRMALLRPRRGLVNSRFLLYSYLAGEFQEVIRQNTIHGATVDRIPLTDMPTWSISLPPIAKQEVIVALLGALDDKIAVNERIGATTHELAECYFLHGLPACDPGQGVSLGELEAGGRLDLGDGYRTKKSEHGKPGLPILRSSEVRVGHIEPEFVDFVHENYRAAMGSKVSRPGDVVLTTKGAFGRTAIMWSDTPDFAYSPQLCYFRVNASSPFSRYYFYHWLRGSEFLGQALGMKGQTDMADYLSLRDLRSLKITLPEPVAEERLSERLRALHGMAESSGRQNRVLAGLRDTLLPKLMSGELRIRDAEQQVEEAT